MHLPSRRTSYRTKRYEGTSRPFLLGSTTAKQIRDPTIQWGEYHYANALA